MFRALLRPLVTAARVGTRRVSSLSEFHASLSAALSELTAINGAKQELLEQVSSLVKREKEVIRRIEQVCLLSVSYDVTDIVV